MIDYPVVIADDFFEDVDYVIKLAQQQDYDFDPNGVFPGKRSKAIGEFDMDLQIFITKKILNLYHSTFEDCLHTSFFQIIDSDLGYGWVHHDNPNRISSVIYLYPEEQESNSGTSLYVVKKDRDLKNLIQVQNETKKFKEVDYKNNTLTVEGDRAREYNNRQFFKTIDINNVFNRCIAFPSSMYHAQNDINCDDSPRLTIVTFIENIVSKELAPLSRMRRVR